MLVEAGHDVVQREDHQQHELELPEGAHVRVQSLAVEQLPGSHFREPSTTLYAIYHCAKVRISNEFVRLSRNISANYHTYQLPILFFRESLAQSEHYYHNLHFLHIASIVPQYLARYKLL